MNLKVNIAMDALLKTHMPRLGTLLLFISLSQLTYGQNEQSADAACFNYDTACSDCIREPNCHWCSKTKSPEDEHKCYSINTDLTSICEEGMIESPTNSDVKILLDQSFTKDASSKKIIQLKPQKIKLSLRKGVPKNITLQYRQVSDYPLDLYYLMDLSNSMKPDKLTLERLGERLARRMTALTSKFNIGFGSFVDKVMLPFVNTHPDQLNRNDRDTATPFSFINNLKLTKNAQRFTKKVREAKISTNIDSPEGGFDALMQVMVCDSEIGWREKVRKIIVFSTDAEFHLAGDGKLAGVVLPNDGKCHLDSDGVYRDYDEYDYPSIGQINEKAKEKRINIIFAVKDKFELYQELADLINGASFGKLDRESSNVINLVTQVYNNITSRVVIADRSELENNPISLRYFSRCNDSSIHMMETNTCDDVNADQDFDFIVQLQLAECPPGVTKVNLTLGTLQDHVEVEIDLQCDCGCEQDEAQGREVDSLSCTSSGTKQCGVCDCNDGFYGNKCQCNQTSNSGSVGVNDLSKCRPVDAEPKSAVCSGRGVCSCETCRCRSPDVFSGTFCQCNKAQCISNYGVSEVCSGNGRCDCDHCQCNPGWENKYCECRTKAACVNKGDPVDKICSGNGECECGVCSCQVKGGIPYSGKYCEECPSCGKGKCEEYRDCVQCGVWNSGKLEGEACKKCPRGKIPQLDSLEDHLGQGATLCTYVDDTTGCFFNFTYLYLEEKYVIFAENKQQCSKSVAAFAAISLISGIVAIGVLTLIIWKILTTIHDRREFAKFENERLNANWDAGENPLYEDPSTTIANPAFSTK